MPITLYLASADQSVRNLVKQCEEEGIEESTLLRNIQAQILLDRLIWVSDDVLKSSACPRCHLEKVDHGPERITSAFADHLSPKLIDKGFQTRIAV